MLLPFLPLPVHAHRLELLRRAPRMSPIQRGQLGEASWCPPLGQGWRAEANPIRLPRSTDLEMPGVELVPFASVMAL